MPKYFSYAFAQDGDKTAIPDAIQLDGSVSYDGGWGYDYQRPDDGSDPLSKNIPRDQTNQLYFDITDNIKHWQDFTAPAWSTARAAAGYKKNARVTYTGGVIWQSKADNNTGEPGVGADWIVPPETDATLLAIGATTPTANQIIWFSGTDVAATTSITSFGRSFIAAADAAAGVAALGIASGTSSTAGLLRTATNTEVNTSATVTAAVTPDQLPLGASQGAISGGGYQITLPAWLFGVKFNFGRVLVANGVDYDVTMNFSSVCLGFFAGFSGSVGRGDVSVGGEAISETLGRIYYHRDAGGGVQYCWWLAIGV